jgi:hypothetical protein
VNENIQETLDEMNGNLAVIAAMLERIAIILEVKPMAMRQTKLTDKCAVCGMWAGKKCRCGALYCKSCAEKTLCRTCGEAIN